MKKQDAFSVIELCLGIGIPEIDILGGEPLLVPWLKEFILESTGSGITVNLSTNGASPELIDKYINIDTDSLNVGFSLLGLSETHNHLTRSHNFSRAVDGIRTMISAGQNPIVKSVLMRENMNEIRDLVYYLSELGVKRYYLLHEDIIGREPGNSFSFPEYYEFYSMLKSEMEDVMNIGSVAASGFRSGDVPLIPPQPGRCDAGMKKMAVMPDGSVFPCNLFFGMKDFKLGNIFRDSPVQIWMNPLLDIFRKSEKNRCNTNQCEHFSYCRGGCPAHIHCFYGSFDKIDPRCEKKT